MKSLFAILPIVCWMCLGPMDDLDVQAAAKNAIQSARTLAPEQEDPCSQLTPSERRDLGRYLETPQLEEVYPGLAGTAPGHEEDESY